MIAYCWATGRIGFGRKLPHGALPLMSGPARKVRAEISVRARHAYDGKTLLVPGVPEAPSESLAGKAVSRFVDWLNGVKPARHAWKWICEFCFRTSNRSQLPAGWQWLFQSAICPGCQTKIAKDGGIHVVCGGAYAGKRSDPRERKEEAHGA